MYKEVAFDPACMGSMEYYGLVRQHFGFEKGRYIAADVKAWSREAMQNVKQSDLQPVKKKSIKNYLNKLVRSKRYDEFILAHDRKTIKCDAWNQWWQEQIKLRDFSLTVSDSASEGCVNVDSINDGCDQWNVLTSISVCRDAGDIVNALLPLMIISGEVIIVDQYFRLIKNRTLAEIFKASANLAIRAITVVSAIQNINASQVYNREYQKENTTGIQFTWIRAPEKYFHDRYFITDVGAVRCGQGFMPEVKKGMHADFANMNLISRDEAERTLLDLKKLIENKQATELLKV